MSQSSRSESAPRADRTHSGGFLIAYGEQSDRLVLCTGPESSGTRLLTRLVGTRLPAIHRSVPHGGDWMDFRRQGHTDAVVILRDPEITAQSAVNAGHARDLTAGHGRRRWALKYLDQYLPDALRVTYEDLIATPEAVASAIAEYLGVESLDLPEEIYDGNDRWIRSVP